MQAALDQTTLLIHHSHVVMCMRFHGGTKQPNMYNFSVWATSFDPSALAASIIPRQIAIAHSIEACTIAHADGR